MPSITVKLDKKRAARVARWARRNKVSKSDVIRALIDRAEPIATGNDLIATGNDLIAWVNASSGNGLGLARRSRPHHQ